MFQLETKRATLARILLCLSFVAPTVSLAENTEAALSIEEHLEAKDMDFVLLRCRNFYRYVSFLRQVSPVTKDATGDTSPTPFDWIFTPPFYDNLLKVEQERGLVDNDSQLAFYFLTGNEAEAQRIYSADKKTCLATFGEQKQ